MDSTSSPDGLPIRLLGDLQVGAPEAPCQLPASCKTRALLAYLAVTACRHRRSELCALFWEDTADPRAGLRWSLTQLRHALGDLDRELIVADRESVGLCAGSFQTDLTQLAQLTGAPVRASVDLGGKPREALVAALALFHGELLEGLDLPACYTYHEWCMSEREAVSRLHEHILLALIDQDQDQPGELLAHARALIAQNPLNDRGHLEAVRALRMLGRSTEAKAQHAQCCRIFLAELDLGPPPGLDAALATPGRPAFGRPDPVGMEVPAACMPSPRFLTPASLVGRQQEMAEFASALRRVGPDGPADVWLISGVPGIGKSRLLGEFTRLVTDAQGRALNGVAFEAERLRPFGLWIDMLRSLGQEALRADLLEGLRPLTHAGTTGIEVGDRGRLFDAVNHALTQLAHSAPMVVLIDDLQWVDDSSASLLQFLLRQPAGHAALFVLAVREGELEDNAAAQRLVAALAQDRRLRRIALGPLSDPEARVLVGEMAPAADVGRIVSRAQGHPLMLLELTRTPDSADVSKDLLKRLLDTRLSPLSPVACELLSWAAAFGHDVPLTGLVAAQRIEPGAIDAALSELERHDLIVAAGEDGYAFRHDLIRQAAYSRISQPRRRLMHRSIGLALGLDMDSHPECSAEVARHAGLGADYALAAQASVRAGEHGLRMAANREAAEAARRGRGYAARLVERSTRVPLEMALLRIQVLATSQIDLDRLRPEAATIQQAIDDARACRLHDEVARGHYLLSIVHQEAGRIDAARAATLQAAEAAVRSDHLGRSRQLANSARCLVELGRDIGQARVLVAEAKKLAEDAGEFEIEVRWCLGLLHQWDGKLEPALQEIDRAIELAIEQTDRWRQCKCLSAAGMIELERRAPALALGRAEALELAASQLGESAEVPLAQALAAIARRMEGDAAAPMDGAIASLRAADDKSRLAYVLNMVAALDWERGAFNDAEALATEALGTAELISEANEALIAKAMLARTAVALGRPQPAAQTLKTLQAALESPSGFSARAIRSAHEATTYCQQHDKGRAAWSGP
jgi:DNA-binding SARP family transcriptional activator/tetratricopeptide (TPR) repeat protein